MNSLKTSRKLKGNLLILVGCALICTSELCTWTYMSGMRQCSVHAHYEPLLGVCWRTLIPEWNEIETPLFLFSKISFSKTWADSLWGTNIKVSLKTDFFVYSKLRLLSTTYCGFRVRALPFSLVSCAAAPPSGGRRSCSSRKGLFLLTFKFVFIYFNYLLFFYIILHPWLLPWMHQRSFYYRPEVQFSSA